MHRCLYAYTHTQHRRGPFHLLYTMHVVRVCGIESTCAYVKTCVVVHTLIRVYVVHTQEIKSSCLPFRDPREPAVAISDDDACVCVRPTTDGRSRQQQEMEGKPPME